MRALSLFEDDMKLRTIRLSTYAASIVVREAAKVFLQEGSALRAPNTGAFPGNSMETGTFEKKSAEQQHARELRASMVDRVGIKRKSYRGGEIYLCMTGPLRPWGSQSWILENGGVIQLWGTSKYYLLRPRPFLEPAGAGTRNQQRTAYLNKHRQIWNEIRGS
jgi:hypothetical protein